MRLYARPVSLFFVLAVSLAVRLYGITHPLVDYHAWRQCDTASIAVNFLTRDFNLFRPQVFYDGPFPNVVQLELQVTPLVIALLAKVIGYSDTLARCVPVGFALLGVYFVFRLGERWFGLRGAVLSSLFLSILPLGIYFTRTVQPEAFVLFCCAAGVWTCLRWMEDEEKRYRKWAVLFILLIPLAKLTAVFMFVPLVAIAALTKTSLRRCVPLLVWMAASLLLTLLYYKYMQSVAESTFVSSIATKHVWPEFFSVFTNPDSRAFLETVFTRDILIRKSGVLLFAVCLFAVWKQRQARRVLIPWLVAALGYALTIGAIIKYDYYLTTTIPVFALILGGGMATWWEWAEDSWRLRRRFPAAPNLAPVLAGLIVLFLGWSSRDVVKPWYNGDWWVPPAGKYIAAHIPPDRLILTGGDENPMLLFYSRHPGYRIKQYAATPADIDKFRQQGAAYFMPWPSSEYGLLKKTQQYLAQFPAVKTPEGYMYYQLSR